MKVRKGNQYNCCKRKNTAQIKIRGGYAENTGQINIRGANITEQIKIRGGYANSTGQIKKT